MYICVPREKVAPVDTGRTETVQHHDSQSAGPQNSAPVLQSVPVQLPAPSSQQWLGDYSTISTTRLSILEPGGSGDTSVDTAGTELEALMQDVAGHLAVPGSSAAAEVNVLIDFGSGIIAMSEELVEALRRQPGMRKTALTQAFVGHARVVTSLGLECDIVTQSCPLHPTIENSGDRCGLRCRSSCSRGKGAEDLERKTWDRCHDPAQAIGAEGTRA